MSCSTKVATCESTVPVRMAHSEGDYYISYLQSAIQHTKYIPY